MLLLQIAGDREGPAYRQICGRVRAARSQQTSGTHQTPLRSDANLKFPRLASRFTLY